MNDEMLLGVGLILFIILFIPILKTVKCMSMFKENPVIMAFAITSLCIVALYEVLMVPPAQKNVEHKTPDFLSILIPYAALSISILGILLLGVLDKILPIERLRKFQIQDAVRRFWHNMFSVKSSYIRKLQDRDDNNVNNRKRE